MRTGDIRAGVTEALGKENDTQVAKVAWLSNKDNSKGIRINGSVSQQRNRCSSTA